MKWAINTYIYIYTLMILPLLLIHSWADIAVAYCLCLCLRLLALPMPTPTRICLCLHDDHHAMGWDRVRAPLHVRGPWGRRGPQRGLGDGLRGPSTCGGQGHGPSPWYRHAINRQSILAPPYLHDPIKYIHIIAYCLLPIPIAYRSLVYASMCCMTNCLSGRQWHKKYTTYCRILMGVVKSGRALKANMVDTQIFEAGLFSRKRTWGSPVHIQMHSKTCDIY